ncbi:hypothetical protein [Nocardia jinanensis]|nr:hypothetical protein [Nocardia jinanensis]
MSPIPQPPFTEELLADLHAGNIDPELGARLWPAAQRDPEAKRYLDSLDEIRGSLAALRGSERITSPIPGDIAARLNALAESLGGPVGDSGRDRASVEVTEPLDGRAPGRYHFPQPSPGPAATRFGNAGPGTLSEHSGAAPISLDARRRKRPIAAALAAAAVIVVAAGAAFFAVGDSDRETTPTAAPPSDRAEPGPELDTAVALRALGRNDVRGRLADPAALTACVAAAGIDRPVLGSADMDFRGREAVLILVGGRNGAQITALVVGPGCGPGNPEVLAPPTDIG